MPQLTGKPLPVRPIMDATVPGENTTSPVKNISAQDLARRKAGWDAQAEARRVAVEQETRTPDVASRVLRFELWQFGHLWNAYYYVGKKMVPLLPSPSLLSSAMGAIDDAMAYHTTR